MFVYSDGQRTEKLEVDPTLQKGVDLHVVGETAESKPPLGARQYKRRDVPERPNSDDFVDDPDVPPLM